MWWPHPDAFNDLTITDTEEGYELAAPIGSECADWINYHNSTEELRTDFQTSFLEMLREAAEATLTNSPAEVTTNG